MSYSIYNNLTDAEFDKMKERADALRPIFEPIMKRAGFRLNKKGYDEFLGLDFLYRAKKPSGNFGNIGFLYKDNGNVPHFMFYVTKAFDTKGRRLFKREIITDDVTIDFIENNYVQLLQFAIASFKNLGR